ncbi:conserved hypothetical protein [Echinococcus multilocularis]|uniref:Uncharacterized protein n=1 Tax=Echinococcus multilocularis TaxID=6211 RepID=A0A068XWJ6_ECHMU|nr:conserved hypothetical protein [Echinococcus multilocularis]
MRDQLPFRRVFTHNNCVQWFRPIKNINNRHILEDIFKEMTYGNENEVRTAYLAAMDIVRFSTGEALLVFLQNGGLIALKNLINSCHLGNRGQAAFGLALNILEGLLAVSANVRVYFLRYWDMLLRPVKKSFVHFQRTYGCTDVKGKLSPFGSRSEFPDMCAHFYRFRLEERNNSHRLPPDHDVGLFSEYLRTLEIIVHTAPDSTPALLKKVFLANKRLDPFHKSIKDLNLHVPSKEADFVYGPRVDMVRRESLDTPLKIVPYLEFFFNLDEENSKQVDKTEGGGRKTTFKLGAKTSKIAEVEATCFDTIKGIALKPPLVEEPKAPQVKFCQQLDDSNHLAAVHVLSHTTPSIVALTNKNPLFFPSVRKLIDPTGKLEDTALKIMKFKPPKIAHESSGENANDLKMNERINLNLRISGINSAYGDELSKIFDMCLPRLSSLKSAKGTEEVVWPSDQGAEEDDSQGSLENPKTPSSGERVAKDSFDMSIVNSVESYTDYLDRASIQTVDDLARMIVRKALFGILEKPMPDIEGDVAKLCQDFCERSGYSKYSLDSLAEAIVDKVLACLTNPIALRLFDQTVEDEIKHTICQCLHGEQEECKWSKLPKIKSSQVGGRTVTRTSENTQTSPVLSFRKTLQRSDRDKVIRELELNSENEDKTRSSISRKDKVSSLPGTNTALETYQETETRQNGGGGQPRGKKNRPVKDVRRRQSFEGSENNAQKSIASMSQDGDKGKVAFRLCGQKDRVDFVDKKRTVAISYSTEPSACRILDHVFTNVAEQISTQLEATQNARSSAECKEVEVNQQALYVVQRVISNLAIQMSAASTGASESLEESEAIKRRATSIARRVLSHPDISPTFRTSDIDMKNRAMCIVNRIVLGALNELSKGQNSSNQNALQEEEEEADTPIPIVWRPRKISLARAFRTGRLVT